MPQISLSHIARSPRFSQRLRVIRRQQNINSFGEGSVTQTVVTPPPIGTITAIGAGLQREADQQNMPRRIAIITDFALRSEAETFDGKQWQPDIIFYKGDYFLVDEIDDYSEWGEGLIQAQASSIDFVDQAPRPPDDDE